ncbi:MAG: hypothetical protein RL425_1326 [Pseudomonadota bacterium]|jgi:hypothetical protein
MLERLTARAEAWAEDKRRAAIARLAGQPLPPGVTAEANEQGLILSGRGLKLRLIREARMWRFWR